MTTFLTIWAIGFTIFGSIGLVILNLHKRDAKQFATPVAINPIYIEDHIKSGWSVYLCEITMSDGTEREAYVQGDGHVFAESTIEYVD